MAKFTITAARIDGGNATRSHSRKVATVRADTGTEYEVHLECGRFPAEVATLAKTPHGRAWRWAKDTTRGTVAAVLAFVIEQADSINWAGDVRDMRAEFTANEHSCTPAMAVMCTIKSVGSAHPVNGFGPDRRTACIKALKRAGMPEAMATECVDSDCVRGYTPEAAAVPVRTTEEPTSATAIAVTLEVSDQLCSDLLCTAAEGGSTYWAEFMSTGTRKGAHGREWAKATVFEVGDGDVTPTPSHNIDLSGVRVGVARALAKGACRADIQAALLAAVHEDDGGNCDAEAADVVIQLATMNEVRYG